DFDSAHAGRLKEVFPSVADSFVLLGAPREAAAMTPSALRVTALAKDHIQANIGQAPEPAHRASFGRPLLDRFQLSYRLWIIGGIDHYFTKPAKRSRPACGPCR